MKIECAVAFMNILIMLMQDEENLHGRIEKEAVAKCRGPSKTYTMTKIWTARYDKKINRCSNKFSITYRSLVDGIHELDKNSCEGSWRPQGWRKEVDGDRVPIWSAKK